jgi:hypothetical protein
MIIDLTEPERLALANVAAPRDRDEPLHPGAAARTAATAIAKLVPGEPPPVPPKTPRVLRRS